MGQPRIDKEITLQSVETFRTVYALCDIIEQDGEKRLKATHYAVCLQHGRAPTWGIFSGDTSKLTLLFDSRQDIEGHRWYAKKRWRIKQVSQKIGHIVDALSPEDRRWMLEEQIAEKATVTRLRA